VVFEFGKRGTSLLAALHLDDAVVCSLVALQVPLQFAGDVECSAALMARKGARRVHRPLVLVQIELNLRRVRATLEVAGVRSQLRMPLDVQSQFAPVEHKFATHVARKVPVLFVVLLQLLGG